MENNISLRPLEMKDAPRMLEWMRNDDVTHFLNIGGSDTEMETVENFIRAAADESVNVHRAVVNADDTYLGTISLKNIDRDRKEAEYAVAMHMDAIGTGASAKATALICRLGFEELGLERIVLCVREENQRAVKFYKKTGFVSIPCPGYGTFTDDGLLWFENSDKKSGEMDRYPLISVLVVCYNNQKFIYENLESIFKQTYPNIEILIGDDASDEFDSEALINWINRYRTSNIKKIAIFENPQNIGTVANFEQLQTRSNGEFLFNIAADDVLYDENVLMRLYQKAEEIGKDAQMIVAQTEMWDYALKHKIGDFISEETQKFIENASPIELFAECSWHVVLPACFLYKRSLLDVVGRISNKYKYIEDWPFALIITRKGIKPYYADGVSTIKHRDGGISHGNTENARRIFLQYYAELYDIFCYEIEPYLYLLNDSDAKRAVKYAQDRLRAYYRIHLLDKQSAEKPETKEKVKEKHENDQNELARKIAYKRKEQREKTMYNISRKKNVLSAFVITLICTALTLFAGGRAVAFKILGIVLSILFALVTVALVLINVRIRIKERRP